MNRRWIPVFILAALALFPGVAHACPVCFDPRDQSNGTFLASTAFLSLVPLGMLGSVGYWLRNRSRKLDEDEGLRDSDSEE